MVDKSKSGASAEEIFKVLKSAKKSSDALEYIDNIFATANEKFDKIANLPLISDAFQMTDQLIEQIARQVLDHEIDQRIASENRKNEVKQEAKNAKSKKPQNKKNKTSSQAISKQPVVEHISINHNQPGNEYILFTADDEVNLVKNGEIIAADLNDKAKSIDRFPAPSFKDMNVLVKSDDEIPVITEKTVTLPLNFDGFGIKQPLTERQFHVLKNLYSLAEVVQQYEKPASYLKRDLERQNIVNAQTQKDQLKTRLRQSNFTLSEVRSSAMQVNVLAENKRVARQEFDRLDKALNQSHQVPQKIALEEIPADLDLSDYHRDVLEYGQASVEQMREYRKLTVQQLLDLNKKINNQEKAINDLMFSLQALGEENNPFCLPAGPHNNFIHDESEEIAVVRQLDQAAFDDAVKKLTSQVQDTVNTAKHLCTVEIVHHGNQGVAIEEEILSSAETEITNTGLRFLHPTAKADLLFYIDMEIKKETKRGKSAWITFKSLFTKKQQGLTKELQELNALKKAVELSTADSPVVQTKLGNVLRSPYSRNRLIETLKKENLFSVKPANVEVNVFTTEQERLKTLTAVLNSGGATPQMMDAKIAELFASMNKPCLLALLEQMILAIEKDTKSLFFLKRKFGERARENKILIERLKALKATLNIENVERSNAFIPLYKTKALAPLLDKFNQAQKIRQRPGLVRQPLKTVDQMLLDQESPLWKLLNRYKTKEGERLFADAFFNLLGVNSQDEALTLLKTADYTLLGEKLKSMITSAKIHAVTGNLTPQAKNSFTYLVEQLAASMRVGLKPEKTNQLELEKRTSSLKCIKNTGKLEAESSLVDLLVGHPANHSGQRDKILREITYLENCLKTIKNPNDNVNNVKQALTVLRSIVDGTRDSLLSEDDITLLGKVVPEYRLYQCHNVQKYKHEKIETYLIQEYTQLTFSQLKNTLKSSIKLKKEENVLEEKKEEKIEWEDAEKEADDSAPDGFEHAQAMVRLIDAHPLSGQFIERTWKEKQGLGLGNSVTNFGALLFAKNNHDLEDVRFKNVEDDFLKTALNPGYHALWNFYLDAYLFTPTYAVAKRLQALSFTLPGTIVNNRAINNRDQLVEALKKDASFLKLVSSLVQEAIDTFGIQNDIQQELIDDFCNCDEEKFKNKLKEYWTKDKSNQRKNLLSKEENSRTEQEQTELAELDKQQLLYSNLTKEWQNNLRVVVNAFEEVLSKNHSPDVVGKSELPFLKRGAIIRAIGTDRQASAYLEKRLDNMISFLEDKEGHNYGAIISTDMDGQFLNHPATKKSPTCQKLLVDKVRLFLDTAHELPLDNTMVDDTEQFIADYTPQFLAEYQYKRLQALFEVVKNSHEQYLVAINQQNRQALEESFRNFTGYFNTLEWGSISHSLLWSQLDSAVNFRKEIAEMLKLQVEQQIGNENRIQVKNANIEQENEENQLQSGEAAKLKISFTNYRGEYRIFEVPGHDVRAYLGHTTEMMIDNFADLDTRRKHAIHKLATLLEMSLLFDADKKHAVITESNGFFEEDKYPLSVITDYLSQMSGFLVEDAKFKELIESVLDNQLSEIEAGKRPVSTTAELFFQRFGTLEQKDRFHFIYVKHLFETRIPDWQKEIGESLNSNIIIIAEEDNDKGIKEKVIEKLDDMFALALPAPRENSYKPFLQSAFILNNQTRQSLDDVLAEYVEKYQKDDSILSCTVEVGERLASEEYVKKIRIVMLRKYLTESPALTKATALQFIENFKTRFTDDIIDTHVVNRLALTYIGRLNHSEHLLEPFEYGEEAQEAAQALIEFFAPNLMHQLWFAQLQERFNQALQKGGKALESLKSLYSTIMEKLKAGATVITEWLVNALSEMAGTLVNLLQAADRKLSAWLEDDDKDYRNLLLDYLCNHIRDVSSDKIVEARTLEGIFVRRILSGQTYERVAHPDVSSTAELIALLTDEHNSLVARVSFKQNFEEFKNAFSLFLTVDSNHGYYASCLALLHIFELCDSGNTEEFVNQKADQLVWAYEELVKHKGFKHQGAVDALIRQSHFFQDLAPYSEVFAKVVDAYASPAVADAYRLKKVKELIEANNPDPVAAEIYVNSLAGKAVFYPEFMKTPEGRNALVEYLETRINKNMRWSPVASVFIQAVTDEKILAHVALRQRDNRHRLREIATRADYEFDFHNRGECAEEGTLARFKRKDAEAFSFLNKSYDEAESELKIQLGSDAEAREELSSIFQDMLSTELASISDELEKAVKLFINESDPHKKAVSKHIEKFIKTLRKKGKSLKTAEAIGLRVDDEKLEGRVDFLNKMLNSFASEIQLNVSKNDDAEKWEIAKRIDFLIKAVTRYKELVRENEKMHEKLFLTEVISENKIEIQAKSGEEKLQSYFKTLTVETHLAALNPKIGGSESDAAKKSAELDLQELFKGMKKQIKKELNRALVSVLPGATFDENGNSILSEDSLARSLESVKNTLDRVYEKNIINNLARSGKSSGDFLNLANESFSTIKAKFSKSQLINQIQQNEWTPAERRREISLGTSACNLLGDELNKFDRVAKLVKIDEETNVAEIFPFLYVKDGLNRDIDEYIKKYKVALQSLRSASNLEERKKLTVDLLSAFVDMLAVYENSIDVKNLKLLLKQQYFSTTLPLRNLSLEEQSNFKSFLCESEGQNKSLLNIFKSIAAATRTPELIQDGIASFVLIYYGEKVRSKVVATLSATINNIDEQEYLAAGVNVELADDRIAALSEKLSSWGREYSRVDRKSSSYVELENILTDLSGMKAIVLKGKEYIHEFLSEVHRIEDLCLARDLNGTQLPYFMFDFEKLDFLRSNLPLDKRCELANMIKRLYSESAFVNDNYFSLNQELKRGLKLVSDYLELSDEDSDAVAISEAAKAYQTEQLRTRDRENFYQDFIAFLGQPTEWTQESLEDLFVRFMSLKDELLNKLIHQHVFHALNKQVVNVEENNTKLLYVELNKMLAAMDAVNKAMLSGGDAELIAHHDACFTRALYSLPAIAKIVKAEMKVREYFKLKLELNAIRNVIDLNDEIKEDVGLYDLVDAYCRAMGIEHRNENETVYRNPLVKIDVQEKIDIGRYQDGNYEQYIGKMQVNFYNNLLKRQREILSHLQHYLKLFEKFESFKFEEEGSNDQFEQVFGEFLTSTLDKNAWNTGYARIEVKNALEKNLEQIAVLYKETASAIDLIHQNNNNLQKNAETVNPEVRLIDQHEFVLCASRPEDDDVLRGHFYLCIENGQLISLFRREDIVIQKVLYDRKNDQNGLYEEIISLIKNNNPLSQDQISALRDAIPEDDHSPVSYGGKWPIMTGQQQMPDILMAKDKVQELVAKLLSVNMSRIEVNYVSQNNTNAVDDKLTIILSSISENMHDALFKKHLEEKKKQEKEKKQSASMPNLSSYSQGKKISPPMSTTPKQTSVIVPDEVVMNAGLGSRDFRPSLSDGLKPGPRSGSPVYRVVPISSDAVKKTENRQLQVNFQHKLSEIQEMHDILFLHSRDVETLISEAENLEVNKENLIKLGGIFEKLSLIKANADKKVDENSETNWSDYSDDENDNSGNSLESVVSNPDTTIQPIPAPQNHNAEQSANPSSVFAAKGAFLSSKSPLSVKQNQDIVSQSAPKLKTVSFGSSSADGNQSEKGIKGFFDDSRNQKLENVISSQTKRESRPELTKTPAQSTKNVTKSTLFEEKNVETVPVKVESKEIESDDELNNDDFFNPAPHEDEIKDKKKDKEKKGRNDDKPDLKLAPGNCDDNSSGYMRFMKSEKLKESPKPGSKPPIKPPGRPFMM